jgi:p-aminobenzoyl-glutamate transporter AbgT
VFEYRGKSAKVAAGFVATFVVSGVDVLIENGTSKAKAEADSLRE